MSSSFRFKRCFDAGLFLLFAITLWRLVATSGLLDATPYPVAITPAVKRGDLLRLPGVQWSKSRTVVLVASSTCPACNANVAFYREIAAQTMASSSIQTVIVSMESVKSMKEWSLAKELDVAIIYHVDDLASHGFMLTPMVLIVDAGGRVTDIMIRRLGEADQARVLNRLRDQHAAALDNSQQIRELSADQMLNMASSVQAQIVDVRSRDQFRRSHRTGARNIPLEELDGRAPVELDSGTPIIVDCLQPGATACRSAAWRLIDGGFTDVSILIR